MACIWGKGKYNKLNLRNVLMMRKFHFRKFSLVLVNKKSKHSSPPALTMAINRPIKRKYFR